MLLRIRHPLPKACHPHPRACKRPSSTCKRPPMARHRALLACHSRPNACKRPPRACHLAPNDCHYASFACQPHLKACKRSPNACHRHSAPVENGQKGVPPESTRTAGMKARCEATRQAGRISAIFRAFRKMVLPLYGFPGRKREPSNFHGK